MNVTKVLHLLIRFVAQAAKCDPCLSIDSLVFSSLSKMFPTITIGGLNAIVAFDRLESGAILAIARIVGNGLAVDPPKSMRRRFTVFRAHYRG